MNTRAFAFCMAALGALLAACGGASNGTPGPVPCPLQAAQPLPAPPQLLYPPAGATNVPDGDFSLELSYQSGGLSGQWSAPSLRSADSTVNAGPYLIVPTPGAYEYTSSVPALAAATSYTVNVVTPPAGGRCSTTATLGTFTTQ